MTARSMPRWPSISSLPVAQGGGHARGQAALGHGTQGIAQHDQAEPAPEIREQMDPPLAIELQGGRAFQEAARGCIPEQPRDPRSRRRESTGGDLLLLGRQFQPYHAAPGDSMRRTRRSGGSAFGSERFPLLGSNALSSSGYFCDSTPDLGAELRYGSASVRYHRVSLARCYPRRRHAPGIRGPSLPWPRFFRLGDQPRPLLVIASAELRARAWGRSNTTRRTQDGLSAWSGGPVRAAARVLRC